MLYRTLGRTGLSTSIIGFGGEWLERHPEDESVDLIRYAATKGINIIDCWMPDAKSRDIIGRGIAGNRANWFVQGHLGSALKDGQYYKTRDMAYVVPAFEDLLARLKTDYIDLGMIHYVDSVQAWNEIQSSDYLEYVLDLKKKGIVRHIGMSSHNPAVAILAAQTDYIEMILFSINPAFDLVPATENADDLFAETYPSDLAGIAPERAALYQTCERNGVGLTVMKGFAGGRLFDAARSPFGVSLTPVQCLHYALTKPAVASVLVGYDTPAQVDEALRYLAATDGEKDYATVLAGAPLHAYSGACTYCGHCKPCPSGIDIAMVNKLYDLATVQPDVPASLRDHYRSLEKNAADCLACHACESRCPFGVPVAERMKAAAKLFG